MNTLTSHLTQDETFDALGLAMDKIEAAGASPILTDAVIIVGDVRAAIGNRWNRAQVERAEMVRQQLAGVHAATPAVAVKSAPPTHITRTYLLFDNSVQWFAAIARVPQGENASTITRDIPSTLWSCPFIDNLTSREPTHVNLRVNGQTWTAWSISESEYKRVERILELQPSVEEQRRLVGGVA